MFTNFILQRENDTDGLYLYDGENVTGEVLGVFYGGHPPPKEGVYSSSNHMFILFRSDKNASYIGFSASFSATYCRSNTCSNVTTSALPITEMTPTPVYPTSYKTLPVMTSPETELVITSYKRWSSTAKLIMMTSYITQTVVTSSHTEPVMTSSYPELETTSSFTETTPAQPTEPTEPTESQNRQSLRRQQNRQRRVDKQEQEKNLRKKVTYYS